MASRKRKKKLAVQDEDVHLLESMGFSEKTAKNALLVNDNIQDAINSLLNQESELKDSPEAPQSKRRRTNLIDLSDSKSEDEEKIEKKDNESNPLSVNIFPKKETISPNLQNLVIMFKADKDRYEENRKQLLKERHKIKWKIKWLQSQSERFQLVKNNENWFQGKNDEMLWLKEQWNKEEKHTNDQLKQYLDQAEMFDEELKYIDHVFQQKTIQFADEKTVVELIKKDMKSGHRLSADDRNIMLLTSAGRQVGENYNCTICFCEYEIKDFAFFECMHGFCRLCTKMTIGAKVKDGNLHILHCPYIDDEGNNCKHKLTHEEVRLFIGDDELFSKYERLQLHQTLNQTEDCRWCPRPGCETAMFGDKLTPMMTCPRCKMKFCFNCKTSEWHLGTSCDQFQKWKKDNSQADAKFENWKSKNTTPCPKCKSSIEKNGGCMHMTCINCKHEFHWKTGEKWKGYRARYAAPWREDGRVVVNNNIVEDRREAVNNNIGFLNIGLPNVAGPGALPGFVRQMMQLFAHPHYVED